MRKVLVLGAAGIVGQHLRLYQPAGVDAVYTRAGHPYFYMGSLAAGESVEHDLDQIKPDVIINLAGENRPDEVEKHPGDKYHPPTYQFGNERLPYLLAKWCEFNGAHLVQVSTQGIFGGAEAPYPPLHPNLIVEQPVNLYGRQKLRAERYVARFAPNVWTIVRLTFVLGVRPIQTLGRQNPFESMMESIVGGRPQTQVSNRWFSPCFAEDAAGALWKAALEAPGGVQHVGTPVRVTRHDIASRINVWGTYPSPGVIPQAAHEQFEGIAQRPVDTSYVGVVTPYTVYEVGIDRLAAEWLHHHDDRAKEIAMFLGCGYEYAKTRMAQGFGPNHAAVAEDWRKFSPQQETDILEWYRRTDSYVWELSAYHADVGFNYSGMCRGISEHLKNKGVNTVLALGDGIGDLTLDLGKHGLTPIYHDLLDSVTCGFALFRFINQGMSPNIAVTSDWKPPKLPGLPLDAVVALDFFEHVINVEEWVRAVYDMLRPGGLFLAQNAFGIGDMEHGGSIPMHLVCNNRFEKDWDPLLEQVGFVRDVGGWWRKRV